MVVLLVPVLVAIVGLLLYVLATNPKLVEVGRLLFFVGMLWLVYGAAGRTVRLP